MSYDLMLLGTPSQTTPDLMQRIEAAVERSPVIASAEPLLYEIGSPPFPGQDDLADALEEGDVTRGQFEAFCAANALDPTTDLSAGRFLEQVWGIAVLTVHLGSDRDAAQAAFAEMRALGRELGLTLHDPQAGESVSDDYVGVLPPAY
jgi:hypothetical protein